MQTFGKTEYVKRDEHKGFTYKNLRKVLSRDFTIISEDGIPFKSLPNFCNSQIGWVMMRKREN